MTKRERGRKKERNTIVIMLIKRNNISKINPKQRASVVFSRTVTKYYFRFFCNMYLLTFFSINLIMNIDIIFVKAAKIIY